MSQNSRSDLCQAAGHHLMSGQKLLGLAVDVAVVKMGLELVVLGEHDTPVFPLVMCHVKFVKVLSSICLVKKHGVPTSTMLSNCLHQNFSLIIL